VAVSVVVETSDVMLAQLRGARSTWCWAGSPRATTRREYASRPLLASRRWWWCATGIRCWSARRHAGADLVRWPWMLQPPGSPQRTRFEAALREAGIQARLDITETASPLAITALLENSDMAAVMPASQANHYARLGVLRTVPLELPVRVPPICLITREDRALSPAAAQFRRQLLGERN
jgi:DNA-binding transcriptional LysR family regulator